MSPPGARQGSGCWAKKLHNLASPVALIEYRSDLSYWTASSV